jgi:mannose/fructose/N-acetylgalactosamine-specific phosphotransferase system component IIC
MPLSKIMTIGSWLNVIALGWLLVARVVPPEPINMTVFWVFLALALLSGMAYATSQNTVKNKAASSLPPAPAKLTA